VFASTAEGDVVPLRAGARVARRTELVVWRPRLVDDDDVLDAEIEE
jgi:hypothetical protein